MIGRYEYICSNRHISRSEIRSDRLLCNCGVVARRRFGFNFKAPLKEHINTTTGQYVRTENQFKTQLKRMSEEATLRTGIEHDFQPVTITEKESLGVTTAGLDEQAKHRHDYNIPNEVVTI